MIYKVLRTERSDDPFILNCTRHCINNLNSQSAKYYYVRILCLIDSMTSETLVSQTISLLKKVCYIRLCWDCLHILWFWLGINDTIDSPRTCALYFLIKMGYNSLLSLCTVFFRYGTNLNISFSPVVLGHHDKIKIITERQM